MPSCLRPAILCLALFAVLAAGSVQGATVRTEPSMLVSSQEAVMVPAAAGLGPIGDAASVGHLLDMDLRRLLALVLGVGVGTFVVETYLGGGPLHFVGTIGGAMLGEWWYREGMWPFGKSRPWWSR